MVLENSTQKKYLRALVWGTPNVLQTSASWGTEVILPVSLQKSFDFSAQGTIFNTVGYEET